MTRKMLQRMVLHWNSMGLVGLSQIGDTQKCNFNGGNCGWPWGLLLNFETYWHTCIAMHKRGTDLTLVIEVTQGPYCSNKACCDCDTSKNGVARDLYVQHLTALMHCTRGYSSNQVALAVIARSAADTPVEVPGRKSLKREKVQKFIQVTNLYEKIEKTKTPGSSELHCRTKSFSESKPHRRATKLRWLRSTLSKRRNWSRSHPCLLQSP